MNPTLPVIEIGDRCRYLLSKGMFINANEPGDERPVGDGHFWCGRNQRIYGPDEQLCSDERCRNPSRICYQSR
jgi:hypothetical protein